jgi:hypothetical protein
VFESEPKSEEDLREKASRWLNDVALGIHAQAELEGLNESDVRFLERIERGSLISDKRIEVLATLQDRRERFFIEHGADPLMEQFLAFKLSLEK